MWVTNNFITPAIPWQLGMVGAKRFFYMKKNKSFSLAPGFKLIVGKANKDDIPVQSVVVQAEELMVQS